MSNVVASFGSALVDFVYPPFCPLCGDVAEGVALCESCVAEWRPEDEQWCDRCGAPVGPYLDTSSCTHCRTDRFQFDGVRALGVYEGRWRTVCRIGKEACGAHLLVAFGNLLADVHREWFESVRADVVISVPRHWTTRWWSDHDSAGVLSGTLARLLRCASREGGLRKVRRTKPQSKLTSTERRRNLRGAFAAGAGSFEGLRVLLVDDVLTTGTTADRCARVLREAGAETVHVAVLALGIGA